MKGIKVVHLALLICVTVLVLLIFNQGDTIRQQQQLIEQMVKNPDCLIP